jgi:hypothetical protein
VLYRAVSALLRSHFAKSTARPHAERRSPRTSFVPSDGRAVLHRAADAASAVLGKVAEMQTEPTSEPRSLLAKLLSALRGDKYMVDAYPPNWLAPAREPEKTEGR